MISRLAVTAFSHRSDVELYSYRFDRFGWALMFLDEATGTVAIHSDYGDFAFSWPQPGRGRGSLKEFLCSSDCDYLARKLATGRDEYDHEGTIRDIKREILEARWEHDLDLAAARDLYDWVVDEAPESPELLVERMPGGLVSLLGDAPWEYIRHAPPSQFLWLRDGLLPGMLDEIRKTMPAAVAA